MHNDHISLPVSARRSAGQLFRSASIYRHPRRPRYERAAQPPALRLTPRDIAILQAVADYQLLRRDQIQALFFPSVRTCVRALARLYHHAYLDRLRPYVLWGTGDSPAIYTLDRKGTALLVGLGDAVTFRRKETEIRSLFLHHALAVNDVRIAVTRAVQIGGMALAQWLTEREFLQRPDTVEMETADGTRRRRQIRPDAFFVIRQQFYTSRFLLEVDLATEDNPRFGRDKVKPGLLYLKSAAYKQRFGYNSGRWLVVTTSEKRLHNLKHQTEAVAGRAASVFYFTTFAQVSPATILTAPIWRRGGETTLRPLLRQSDV